MFCTLLIRTVYLIPSTYYFRKYLLVSKINEYFLNFVFERNQNERFYFRQFICVCMFYHYAVQAKSALLWAVHHAALHTAQDKNTWWGVTRRALPNKVVTTFRIENNDTRRMFQRSAYYYDLNEWGKNRFVIVARVT